MSTFLVTLNLQMCHFLDRFVAKSTSSVYVSLVYDCILCHSIIYEENICLTMLAYFCRFYASEGKRKNFQIWNVYRKCIANGNLISRQYTWHISPWLYTTVIRVHYHHWDTFRANKHFRVTQRREYLVWVIFYLGESKLMVRICQGHWISRFS